MDEDCCWHFGARKKQEVRRLLYLVATLSKTLCEQGEVCAIAIHHDHLSHENRAFLNRDAFVLGAGRMESGLVLCHRLLLENLARYCHTGSNNIVSCVKK